MPTINSDDDHSRRRLRFVWEIYKALHPLCRFRKHNQEVLEFLTGHMRGRMIAIDSFVRAPYFGPIDRVIELEDSRFLWEKLHASGIEFVPSLTDIKTEVKYDTVLALGLAACKYKNLTECVEWIAYLASLMTKEGQLFVALPITTLLFHRLKMSYDDAIGSIDQGLTDQALTISDRLLHIDVLYLQITSL